MMKGYGKGAMGAKGAGGCAKGAAKGGCAKGAGKMGKMQPQMIYEQVYEEPVAPAAPSFIGGAARKRRLDLAREAGLLPPLPGMQAAMAGVQAGAPVKAMAPAAAKKLTPAKPAMASPVAGSGAKWIQVGADSPIVAEQGLPELAPTISHAAGPANLLSASTLLLWEIAGDAAAGEVELMHDTEWAQFPDVGAAVKAAEGEDMPICVAVCPSQAKWAVGAAGNWKKREQAARLALCVALAANVEDFGKLSRSQPEFTRFCEASGIATDCALGAELAAAPAAPATFKRAAAAPAPDPADALSKKARKAAAAAEWAATQVAAGQKLQRDAPLWLLVEEEMPEQLALMMPEAVAVVTDGTNRKGLYSSAERAIALLVENPASVEYHDDCNWTIFGPSVGKALKNIAPEEVCMCVSVCAEKEVWGVGLSSKGKVRWAASKAALATALAMKAIEEGAEVNLSQEPAIAEFVAEAQAARV